MTNDGHGGPLDGVKVLEIAQVMAIPVCAVLLSDMGARVVKLEPPWGDAARYTMLPVLPGESRSFAVLNRGKRSVGLDLADGRSRPALEALVRWADVVLVSMKDADLEAYRVGYEHLRPLNPEMVYLEHTPLGHKGPMGGQGSYDLVVNGLSGLTALIGKARDGQPQYTQPAMSDMSTGFLSAMAVCAALYHRRATGKGQRIETSLLSSSLAAMANVAHDFPAADGGARERFLADLADLRARGAPYEDFQRARERSVRRASRGNIYYRYYRTKDAFISVGCLSPGLQAKFREATGIHDPRTDPGFDLSTEGGYQRMVDLQREAEELLRSRTTAEWTETFERCGIPCAPVNFPEEALDHPQVVENGFVIELEHSVLGPYRTFAPPVRMDRTPPRAQGAAPALAQHTEEVLREVGVDAELIASLMNDGVAGPNPLGT